METTHTPGNWIFKEQGDADEFCIVTDESLWVAAFRLNGIQTLERQRANGKLMAAAPNLLEACQKVFQSKRGESLSFEVLDSLYEAIKKATE